MTHSIQLLIIGLIVFAASYIILRLLRNNERLILELEEAKTKVKTLDADLYEARRSNNKANAYIEQLNSQLDVMGKRLAEYNNEAKSRKISFDLADFERRKTIQHLYGRIGAMQKQINRLKQYH
jgi:chromosome segregation ATPase